MKQLGRFWTTVTVRQWKLGNIIFHQIKNMAEFLSMGVLEGINQAGLETAGASMFLMKNRKTGWMSNMERQNIVPLPYGMKDGQKLIQKKRYPACITSILPQIGNRLLVPAAGRNSALKWQGMRIQKKRKKKRRMTRKKMIKKMR